MSLSDAIHALCDALKHLPASTLTVAYSGGVDSTVLLHALHHHRSDFPQHALQAVHVHHGLSVNADHWAAHCDKTCQALGIPLYIERVKVEDVPRSSLEAAAREARYKALYQRAARGVVLTGQHQDDQLETLLLQLKRGAGPAGLSGMAEKQHVSADMQLWRPLLPVPRGEIEDSANTQSLTWIEDESNSDMRFDRNFLRHQVLPLLNARWPGMTASAARSARLCAEQQHLLAQAAEEKMLPLLTSQSGLDVQGLSTLSEAWQRQVVRLWLKRQNAQMPSERQLAQMDTLLTAKEDAQPQLQWGRWQLRRFQGGLYLLDTTAQGTPDDVQWSAQTPLTLAHLQTELHFSGGQGGETLQIRYGDLGTRFTPTGMPHSKPLKQWFKEWRIPPWERQRVAQVYWADQLLALVMPTKLVCGDSPAASKLSVKPI